MYVGQKHHQCHVFKKISHTMHNPTTHRDNIIIIIICTYIDTVKEYRNTQYDSLKFFSHLYFIIFCTNLHITKYTYLETTVF